MTSDSDDVCRRVLLCTSPLQVLNARAAMDYESPTLSTKDYVVIIHPFLSDHVRNKIRAYASRLKFEAVVDMSRFSPPFFSSKGLVRDRKRRLPSRSRLKDRLAVCRQSISRIETALEKEVGKIDHLYFRVGYGYLDSLYIRAQNSASLHTIEDGYSDYLPPLWYIRSGNLYAIRHFSREWIMANLLAILARLFGLGYCGEFQNLRLKADQSYTNLDRVNAHYVGDHFVNTIKRCAPAHGCESSVRVLIVGSLIATASGDFQVDKEIWMYNKLIEYLQTKHQIRPREIWYRHHPRQDKEIWKQKKDKMKCELFDYDDCSVVEEYFLLRQLTAVYSVGSTALLYAKVLFNLESYFIDLQEFESNREIHRRGSILANKYSIPCLRVTRGGQIL